MANRPFSRGEARDVGERIGIDWQTGQVDLEQFRLGLMVELEHGPRGLGLALLGVAVRQDRGSVLRPVVSALAHPLRRVVLLPKHLEQLAIRDAFGVEHHADDLDMAGPGGADLLVCRVRG